MNELQSYYDAISQAHWAHEDPKVCGCRGCGWLLSDLDTWHECPLHGGQPHPEDDVPEEMTDEECERQEAENARAAQARQDRVVVGRRMGTPVYAPVDDDEADVPF